MFIRMMSNLINNPGKRKHLILRLAMMLILVIAVIPFTFSDLPGAKVPTASASCWSYGCSGYDPVSQGCNMMVQTGAYNAQHSPELYVEVRKTLMCGGVKWARADRSTFLNGRPMHVWLQDAYGNHLYNSEYVNSYSLEIYGNMGLGAVQACVSVDGYTDGWGVPIIVCTPTDY